MTPSVNEDQFNRTLEDIKTLSKLKKFDATLYEKIIRQSFEYFKGDLSEKCINEMIPQIIDISFIFSDIAKRIIDLKLYPITSTQYVFTQIVQNNLLNCWEFLNYFNQNYTKIINLHTIKEQSKRVLIDYENFPDQALYIKTKLSDKVSNALSFLTEGGILTHLISKFSDQDHLDTLIKFYQIFSKYLVQPFSDYLVTEATQICVDIRAFRFYMSLDLSESVYQDARNFEFTLISDFLQSNTDMCLDELENIINNLRTSTDLEYLKFVFESAQIDNDNEKYAKVFGDICVLLFKKEQITYEKVIETLKENRSLIKYVIPCLVHVPEDLIEMWLEQEPKKASIKAIDCFENGNTNFKNKEKIYANIVMYANENDFQPMLGTAIDYSDTIIELAHDKNVNETYDLKFDDERELLFYLNLCSLLAQIEFLKNIEISGVEHISESLLERLDSSLIPYIFDTFSFLPICDVDYFIDLCPMLPKTLSCFSSRKMYPHIAIDADEYRNWSKEAFEQTKEGYFAEQYLMRYSDRETIQTFVDTLKNIDFVFSALEKTNNTEKRAEIVNLLVSLDLSKVSVKNYMNDIVKAPQAIDVLYMIPQKYEFSDFNTSEKFNNETKELANHQILYIINCLTHYVTEDEFWCNIKVECDVTESVSSAFILCDYLSKAKKQSENQDLLVSIIKKLSSVNQSSLFITEATKAAKEVLQFIDKTLLDSSFMKFDFRNREISQLVFQNVNLKTEQVCQLLEKVPYDVYPVLLSSSIDQSEELIDTISQLFTVMLSKISDPSVFEQIFCDFVNFIKDENQKANICSKVFFSFLPPNFRTKRVCDVTDEIMRNNENLLEDKLSSMKDAKSIQTSAQNSPFIQLFSLLTSYIGSNSSELAKDALLSLLNNKVIGYDSIESVLKCIKGQKEFAIEVSGLSYLSYSINLDPQSTSVICALSKFTMPSKEVDNQGNDIFNENRIMGLSKYLVLTCDENNTIKTINDTLTPTDLNYEYDKAKIAQKFNLVGYVGKNSTRSSSYVLNGGEYPVLILYSCNDEASLLPHMLSNMSSDIKAQSVFIDSIQTNFDFSSYEPKPLLSLLLVEKVGNSQMLEKGFKSQNFVDEFYMNNLLQLFQNFDNIDKNVIFDSVSKISEPIFVVLSCEEILPTDPELIYPVSEFLSHLSCSIDSFVDALNNTSIEDTEKEYILGDFLSRNLTRDTKMSDETIMFITSQRKLRKYIFRLNDERFIPFILPIADKEDAELLIENSTKEFAAKVLLQNGNMQLNILVLHMLKDVKEFSDHVLGNDLNSAIMMFANFEDVETLEKAKNIMLRETSKSAPNDKQLRIIEQFAENMDKLSHEKIILFFIAAQNAAHLIDGLRKAHFLAYAIAYAGSSPPFMRDEFFEALKNPKYNCTAFCEDQRYISKLITMLNMQQCEKPVLSEIVITYLLRQNYKFDMVTFSKIFLPFYRCLTEPQHDRIGRYIQTLCQQGSLTNIENVRLYFTKYHRYLTPIIGNKNYDDPFISLFFPLFCNLGSEARYLMDFESMAVFNYEYVEYIISVGESPKFTQKPHMTKLLFENKLNNFAKLRTVKEKSCFIRIVRNLCRVSTLILSYALEPSFIDSVSSNVELSGVLCDLCNVCVEEAAAESTSLSDTLITNACSMLMKSVNLSVKAQNWSGIRQMLELIYRTMISPIREILKTHSFDAFFGCLKFIPVGCKEDLLFIRKLCILVLNNRPNDYNVESVKEFVETLTESAEEAERFKIAFIMISKCPQHFLPMLKNVCLQKFTKLRQIKEFERQCDQILNIFAN